VQTGILTSAKYLKDIKEYRVNVESLLKEAIKELGSKSTHTMRLQEKVRLLQVEISSFEEEL
jgi:hypothetical protein